MSYSNKHMVYFSTEMTCQWSIPPPCKLHLIPVSLPLLLSPWFVSLNISFLSPHLQPPMSGDWIFLLSVNMIKGSSIVKNKNPAVDWTTLLWFHNLLKPLSLPLLLFTVLETSRRRIQNPSLWCLTVFFTFFGFDQQLTRLIPLNPVETGPSFLHPNCWPKSSSDWEGKSRTEKRMPIWLSGSLDLLLPKSLSHQLPWIWLPLELAQDSFFPLDTVHCAAGCVLSGGSLWQPGPMSPATSLPFSAQHTISLPSPWK